MAFFAMSSQVLFHDTMAYGTSHHMTNIKFQNQSRETLLFEGRVGGQLVWREQLKDIVLLTREVFSLNLAPVPLGEKVGILLTFEDASRSSVRLCFRVVRADGQPVACGYQTMICIHKDTFELVPAPPVLSQYADPNLPYSLIEKLVAPSFAERARSSSKGTKEIFTSEICSLGRSVANAPLPEAYPRILDVAGRMYPLGS